MSPRRRAAALPAALVAAPGAAAPRAAAPVANALATTAPVAAVLAAALVAAALVAGPPATAQPLDLTQGGPVDVTSTDGIEWRQAEQVVIARGNARAVREGVTLEGDRLIARYRSRAATPGSPAAAAPAADTPMSGGEIWRMEAEGSVRISTATDRAQGDRAVYDMDQSVMVLTGRDLKLTTPQDTITARDSLEYWAQRRMAVARGAAGVVTADNRRIAADTLVGYFLEQAPPAPARPATPPRPGAATPPAARPVPGEGSKLDRVEVFGNVEIRTPVEVVRGDRGVYSPVTGTARLLGNVRITRGDNQLNGAEAIVNLRSGVARLVSAPGSRVQGLVLPQSGQEAGAAGRRAPQGPPGGRTPAAQAQPGAAQPGQSQSGQPQPGQTQPGQSQAGQTQPGNAQPGAGRGR